MNKLKLFLFLSLPCLFLGSCRSSDLLNATFETDTIGNRPETNLPGDPTGDVIRYNAAIANQLVVQTSGTAGEKALHFRNAPISGDISGHNKWLNFRGINSDLATTLWFTHSGSFTGATGDVLIDVSDGYGGLIARMRIKANGEVALARTILDAAYSDVLGTLSGAGHTIVFTATVSELKYNVTIFQTGGVSIPPASDRPMITTNRLHFRNPTNPSISFMHHGGANINHRYIIESVVISKKKPD
jgi:hypothetical protein